MKPRNSRSRGGTDGSRAERPAEESPRLPFPDSGPAGFSGEGEGGPRSADGHEGRRRRRRRRRSEGEAGTPTQTEQASPEAGESREGEAGEAPKSGRAARRRRAKERRRAAEGGAQQEPRPAEPKEKPAKQGGPKAAGRRDDRPKAREAGARQPDREGRRKPRQRAEERVEGKTWRRQADQGSPERVPVFGADDDDIELPPGITGFDADGRPIFSRQGRQATKKAATPVRRLESLSPSTPSLAIIGRLEEAIEEVAPLNPKHRAALRGDVRKLWEDLTSDRERRPADYLGTPASLSAYLRYFLPWNVYRLSAILSNADFCLPDNAVIVDIGSGPLTFVMALWASRPELREVPLTIYCVDRVERVMETGLAIFETLCLRSGHQPPPWRIELRKEAFGAPLPERAHLLTAANVFNEFFWKDKSSLGERALETTRSLLSYLRENGSLFVMEPGDPRSGAFISALRAGLLAEGASPLGPCPHSYACPLPGIFRHLLPPERQERPAKGDPNAAPSRYHLHPVVMPKKRDKFPWCHFGIDTEAAPGWLHALSAEAGLPKERAVLSYLWAARGVLARPVAAPVVSTQPSERERRARAQHHGVLVRVVSEPFGLSDGSIGQYGCSNLGYSLLRRPRDAEPFESGDLLEVQASPLQRNDEKSGAVILPT